MDKQVDQAMRVLSDLSNAAKESGDIILMYAANRAWHELHNARRDHEQSQSWLALTNGELQKDG